MKKMKKMKNRTKIGKLMAGMLMAGSLLMASCDSYLDIQPVGKVIPNTLAEHRALLTTVYNTKLMDKSVTELRTDIAQVNPSSSTSFNTYGEIEIWNDLNPKAGTREFTWDKYYTNIFYANAIIDKGEKMTEGSAEDIRQLIGEAHLMRAYMHFILVNLYGQPYTKAGAPETKAVPVKWDLDLEAVPVRSTVSEVYAAILADIESARTLMNREEWEEAYRYRFSTRSVDALEARVHLYMGNWQAAYDAAQRVLAQQPALEDLNKADSKLPCDYRSAEMITAYELFNDDVTSSLILTPAFIATYDASGDLRPAKYFTRSEEGHTISIKSGKAEQKCTFRTGELYLTAAEAAARLNQLPAARQHLLKLMEKRYNAAGYAAKKKTVEQLPADALLTEILSERARELAVEGHRWFDLRRTTRERIEKTVKDKRYVLEQDDARYTLRIPQAAIEANPGLLN